MNRYRAITLLSKASYCADHASSVERMEHWQKIANRFRQILRATGWINW